MDTLFQQKEFQLVADSIIGSSDYAIVLMQYWKEHSVTEKYLHEF
jgi:hypothetical protein